MKAGIDYIGVGVGAMIFNSNNEIFLTKRGLLARNEQGTWEFPGGQVDFGETLETAIIREIKEEFDFEIEVVSQIGAFNHFINKSNEHWVSFTFICNYVHGIPKIQEPTKCEKISWFNINEIPKPLSIVSEDNLNFYNTYCT